MADHPHIGGAHGLGLYAEVFQAAAELQGGHAHGGHVQPHHVGLHLGHIDADAQLLQAPGQGLGLFVIQLQVLVMVQAHDARRSHDAALAPAAAQHLPHDPGPFDHGLGAHHDGADGAGKALAQAKGYHVHLFAQHGGVHLQAHRRVQHPGAVQIDRDPMPVGHVAYGVNMFLIHHQALVQVKGVLQAHQGGGGVLDGGGDDVGLQLLQVVMAARGRQRTGLYAADLGQGSHLQVVHVGLIVEDDLLALVGEG